MGGCDRTNSLRSSYNTYLTHKKRWYMSLFYYGLDVLIVNALIYGNEGRSDADQLSQKAFRLHVVRALSARSQLERLKEEIN